MAHAVADFPHDVAKCGDLRLRQGVDQERADDFYVPGEELEKFCSPRRRQNDDNAALVFNTWHPRDQTKGLQLAYLIGEPASTDCDAVGQVGHPQALSRAAHQAAEKFKLDEG